MTLLDLTVPEPTHYPCATCDDGLANHPGGICGQCFMDGKIAPADDDAFVDPLQASARTASAADGPKPVICRIDGCDQHATHQIGGKGRYANTCDAHYQAEREKASTPKRRQAHAQPKREPARQTNQPKRSPNSTPATGKPGKPQTLVAAAEQLETARTAHREAVAALSQARAHLAEKRAQLLKLASADSETEDPGEPQPLG